jgi:hypothetical protein
MSKLFLRETEFVTAPLYSSAKSGVNIIWVSRLSSITHLTRGIGQVPKFL